MDPGNVGFCLAMASLLHCHKGSKDLLVVFAQYSHLYTHQIPEKHNVTAALPFTEWKQPDSPEYRKLEWIFSVKYLCSQIFECLWPELGSHTLWRCLWNARNDKLAECDMTSCFHWTAQLPLISTTFKSLRSKENNENGQEINQNSSNVSSWQF